MVKWYEVHQQLSDGLLSFYENCKSNKKDPGYELYKLLINDTRFRELNQWIEKFNQKFGVESLDPIHIFFSFHANSMRLENRQKRVRLLFEILLKTWFEEEVDFTGCPAPAIIQILTARAKSHQDEIWNLFVQIKKRGRAGLTPSDFARYKKWYGIEFKSFTTFLFYIESDHFLPLESNVEGFINKVLLAENVQKNYNGYIEILQKIDPFNNSLDNGYGPTGIFREISFWAYIIVSEEKAADKYTAGIDALLHSVNKNVAAPLKELNKGEADFQFRLIAIGSLPGCDTGILNNLSKDHLYYFEKTVEIGAEEIRYFPERSLKLFKPGTLPRLNITAIVGKNGSGKSSLVELLFRVINNISFINAQYLGTYDLEFVPQLFAELYYVYKGFLYRLELKDKDIFIEQFAMNAGIYSRISRSSFTAPECFNHFFYTIAVNYSHYALNAKEIGTWVNGLFHKNDGYQTPLVINPKRTNGDIDINKENGLTTSRLISLLLAPVDENNEGFRQITDKQKAVEIKVSLKKDQEFILFEAETGEKIKLEQLAMDQDEIFRIIKNVFGLEQDAAGTAPEVLHSLKQYMICKLVRIARNYYPGYDFFDSRKIAFKSFKAVRELANKIKTNQTHSTYKFKQAINYWKFKDLWRRTEAFVININADTDLLNNLLAKNEEHGKLIEFIPPSIFQFEIILENTDKSNSSFSKLSSGEKQLVYSVSSLLYHLNNIDSVHYSDEYAAYDAVNIILDEIELYYHPAWQKRYIDYLLTHIANFELPNVQAVNICFVTHSPYILSDIPDNYTLKLAEKKLSVEASKTFAANIHDLLANDFFLEDGFMGEFAKKKITEIIQYLNIQSIRKRFEEIEATPGDINIVAKRRQLSLELDLWMGLKRTEAIPKYTEQGQTGVQIEKEFSSSGQVDDLIKTEKFMDQVEYQKIIETKGEPILRQKLLDMYREVFGNEEEKTREFLKLAGELNYKVSKN